MHAENRMQFVATFADGSQIFQNEEDLSAKNPGKNCYFDVLERAEELVSFVIIDNERLFGVDLRDGHFEVVDRKTGFGVPYFQHRPDLDQRAYDFKLVWHRTVKQEIDRSSGEPVRAWVAGYTIGWYADVLVRTDDPYTFGPETERIEKTMTVYFENAAG